MAVSSIWSATRGDKKLQKKSGGYIGVEKADAVYVRQQQHISKIGEGSGGLISEQDDFRPAAVGKIDPAPDFLTIGIEIDDEQAVLWGDVQQLFKGDAPCGRYDTGDNHAHQKRISQQ